MKRNIFDGILGFSKKSGISDAVDRSAGVLIAFSGGADSTLLFEFFLRCFPNKPLFAAHMDHMIRGEESREDLLACRSFAGERGVFLFEKSVDVPRISKESGLGTEECARRERYLFFDECRIKAARELGVGAEEICLATGHNGDDSLETALLNFTRGAGPRGMKGIPPVRGERISPLLCLSSAEIREFCDGEGIGYRVDRTNEENDYSRNRIRHFVVPELERLNPSVRRAAERSSVIFSEEDAFLDGMAREALGKWKDGTRAPRELIASLDPVIGRRAVTVLYRNLSDRDMTFFHAEKMLELARKDGYRKLDLPCGITARIGEMLILEKSTAAATEALCDEDLGTEGNGAGITDTESGDGVSAGSAAIGETEIGQTDAEKAEKGEKGQTGFFGILKMGENVFSKQGFLLTVEPGHPIIYNKLINSIRIDGKIKGNLTVRNRLPGDSYRFRGHSRKVKELFIDAKIPRERRDSIPIVCDGDGILWIPGFPQRDGTLFEGDGGILITYSATEKENRL